MWIANVSIPKYTNIDTKYTKNIFDRMNIIYNLISFNNKKIIYVHDVMILYYEESIFLHRYHY